MHLIQVDKSLDYILSHIDTENLYFITVSEQRKKGHHTNELTGTFVRFYNQHVSDLTIAEIKETLERNNSGLFKLVKED